VLKVFHYARFDMGLLKHLRGDAGAGVLHQDRLEAGAHLHRPPRPEGPGLKDLVGVDISKQQQSSDWAAETLSEPQIAYAASDVLYLHALKAELDRRLLRERRAELADACFGFLPARALLDLSGWEGDDIFAH
jgi:ribonuclease D